MAAECGRAAGGDVSEDPLLGGRRPMPAAIVIAAGPDDVGDLEAGSPRVHGGCSAEDGGGWGSEQVERALGARDVLDTDVGVDLGRGAKRGEQAS
jgi:hypothetical protein